MSEFKKWVKNEPLTIMLQLTIKASMKHCLCPQSNTFAHKFFSTFIRAIFFKCVRRDYTANMDNDDWDVRQLALLSVVFRALCSFKK